MRGAHSLAYLILLKSLERQTHLPLGLTQEGFARNVGTDFVAKPVIRHSGFVSIEVPNLNITLSIHTHLLAVRALLLLKGYRGSDSRGAAGFPRDRSLRVRRWHCSINPRDVEKMRFTPLFKECAPTWRAGNKN
jgi:hypothetical protein